MKRTLTKTNRRMGVAVNYLSLVLAIAFYLWGKHAGWSGLITAVALISLAVALFSFVYVHVKTSLWSLVHTRVDELDERQIQVTHYALRYSYGIFSVTCLVLIYLNSVLEKGSFDIVIAASLVYFAHTLPSSVIAWTEKEV